MGDNSINPEKIVKDLINKNGLSPEEARELLADGHISEGVSLEIYLKLFNPSSKSS